MHKTDKILLLGSSGQVGSEILFKAKELKCNILHPTRQKLDITNFNNLEYFIKNAKNIKYIINAAAYTAVDKAENDKDLAYLINIIGVKNLVKICRKYQIILIHISTDYVFNGKKCNNYDYTELDQVGPLGVYGNSKLAGDLSIINNLDKYYIFRVSWVFGRFGNNFVKTMLKLFSQKSKLSIVADQFGKPTYAKDIAEMILQILFNFTNKNFGLYNYSGAPKISWYDFSKKILSISQRLFPDLIKCQEITPISTVEYPTLALRPMNSGLDCTKFINTFKINIKHWEGSLYEVLSEYGYTYFQTNINHAV